MYTATSSTAGKSIKWTPLFAQSGDYSIYVNLPDGTSDRDAEATYLITHNEGVATVRLDQRNRGGRWMYLGTYAFRAGNSHRLELTNLKRKGNSVAANTIKVVREETRSGDGKLSVKARPVSDGVVEITIEDTNANAAYWIERISDGGSFGFEVPKGTRKFTDYSADSAQSYRVRKIGRRNFATCVVGSYPAVEKNANILVSAAGYLPDAPKQALIKTALDASRFSVIDAQTGLVVLPERDLVTVSDPISTTLKRADFTDLTVPGVYRLKTDMDAYSAAFRIADDLFSDVLTMTVRNLKQTRWPATKIATREDTGKPMDIGGGWEDAWDFKHWTSYTDTMQPFVLLSLIESGIDVPGAHEELLHGLDYLMKIQEMNPAGSGAMKYGQLVAAYSDVVSSDSTPYVVRVENVDLPDMGGYNKRCEHVIAHYIYATVMAKAAALFPERTEYADRAIAAFAYMDTYDELPNVKYAEYFTTKDYFRAYPILNYAYKALAAVELFKLTKDVQYRTKAAAALNEVSKAQRRDYAWNSSKVCGLFLKEAGSSELLRNRVHGGIPLYALTTLLRELPDASDADWFRWYASAKLFVDGFVKRTHALSAYGILPYGFGVGPRKMNAGDLLNYRFFQGTETEANGYSDGNTKLLALYAAALYEYAITTGDKSAADIAARQLEWLFGANVFGTPVVVGFGEIKAGASRVTTHGFAADSMEAVGAVVNGIDGGSASDNPQWTNTWQTGETWGVNRAWLQLAISAHYKQRKHVIPTKDVEITEVTAPTSVVKGAGSSASVRLRNYTAKAKRVQVRFFAQNATPETTTKSVEVPPLGETAVTVPFTGIEAKQPAILAAFVDGNRENAKSALVYVD
ncbi:glycoside hydrolase family 9 protein [Paenibacillus sp. FSL W8-0426]|uniref:golvesin C-terminal-like domain-containing protein n=1 Tax=Paenibacillus sp. FSL W8-0426 TaxID=2921714 RepID=UPI0030DBCA8F